MKEPLPISEVARRLCIAEHPFLHTTGTPVPCGTHTGEASRLYALTTSGGDKPYAVIRQVRLENGLPV